MNRDKNGRYWAKVKNVVVGSRIEHDCGSDCWTESRYTVKADESGYLYIDCSEGRHYLNGQVEGDHYVGLYQIK